MRGLIYHRFAMDFVGGREGVETSDGIDLRILKNIRLPRRVWEEMTGQRWQPQGVAPYNGARQSTTADRAKRY